MKLAVLGSTLALTALLSACNGQQEAPVTNHSAMGNGVGSQYGNYVDQADGEMRGPNGERCVVHTWDRPLTATSIIRVRSASCESRENPGQMVSSEISREVVPVAAPEPAAEAQQKEKTPEEKMPEEKKAE